MLAGFANNIASQMAADGRIDILPATTDIIQLAESYDRSIPAKTRVELAVLALQPK